MGYDPNQPPYGAPNQPPYGAPNQPPYGAPNQPPYGAPNQPPYLPQASYGVPPYGQPQAAPKKSRRGLWIILAIVGGILVLACGGCALLGVFGAKMLAGPTTAVDSYYKAVESQDYNTAYSYLQVDTFTIGGQKVQANAGVFAQSASYLDQTKGKVSSHSITSTNVTNDTATVKVEVTRNGSPSTVTLQLKQVGNDWKIVQLDNI